MKTVITLEVDTDCLASRTDEYLAQLWHVGQANPAPFGDAAACNFAEKIGREIIRRFVSAQPPALWTHQASHIPAKARIAASDIAKEA
jgi:hypothetical protein